MATFKFEKGDHIDGFFEKVGLLWIDLFDSDTDQAIDDFTIQITVVKNKKEKPKMEYKFDLPNLSRKL